MMVRETNQEADLHDIQNTPARVARDMGVGLINGVEDIAVTGVHAVGAVTTTVLEEAINVVSTGLREISNGIGSVWTSGSDTVAGMQRGRTGRSTTTGHDTTTSTHS